MAMGHLAEAEAEAQREGLTPELAHTLLAQAECELASSGQERQGRARDLLIRALALFEELNLADAITEVRSRLRALSGQSQDTSRWSLPANLTKSQVKVLQLVAQGKSSRQIAEELRVSEKTVTNHLTHIFMKTESKNRVEATTFAIRHGLV